MTSVLSFGVGVVCTLLAVLVATVTKDKPAERVQRHYQMRARWMEDGLVMVKITDLHSGESEFALWDSQIMSFINWPDSIPSGHRDMLDAELCQWAMSELGEIASA